MCIMLILSLQVREATTLLDLDVLFYPCPKGGPTWRPKVRLLSQLFRNIYWSAVPSLFIEYVYIHTLYI